MQKTGRWMVCSGPGSFLRIAQPLTSMGCDGIEWLSECGAAASRLGQAGAGWFDGLAVESTLPETETLPLLEAAASVRIKRAVICVVPAKEVPDRPIPRGVDVVELPNLAQWLAGGHPDAGIWDGGRAQGPGAAGDAGPRPGVSAARDAGAGACEDDRLPDEVLDAMAADYRAGSGDVAEERPLHVAPGLGTVPAIDVVEPGRDGRSPSPLSRRLPLIDGGELIPEPTTERPVVVLKQVESPVAGRNDPVPTICFASARGGVGKSTLAALTAVALAREGYSVSLIDMDFQFGTCLGYLGAAETDGLFEVGADISDIRVDAHTMARCRTTPMSGLGAYEFCRAPEQAEVLSRFTSELLRQSRAGSDIAVVDLKTGLGETAAQVMELSDRCLFVVDDRALGVESLAAHQALSMRMGIARTKLVTVVNRCDPRHRDEGFLARIDFEARMPQTIKVIDGGGEVNQMLAIGRAAELFNMRNRCVLSVADMARSICSDLGCYASLQAAVGTPMPVQPGGVSPVSGQNGFRLGRKRPKAVVA